MQIFWLVCIIAFAAAEAATVQLVSIWFAAGALAALIASLFHAHLWVQTALFILVSALAVWATRPLVKKYVNSRRKPTNADRILGSACIVTEDIDNIAATGAVSAGGKIWTARSKTGHILEKGSLVRPVAIEGVKLIVIPVQENIPEDIKEEI